jgi:hypothetical protein
MGQCVADFNRDGLFDWYVTSIAPVPGDTGSGNMLYVNQGNDVYSELSVQAGVNEAGWGWGAVAVDFDHDGWVDIAETNGWFLPGYEYDQMYLFMNQGGLRFQEHALASGLDYTSEFGNSLLSFDPDRDGDMDLVAFGTSAELHYFRNDLSGPDAHGLLIRLDSAGMPGIAPDGEGASIRVTTGGTTQVGHITGGASYLSASELVAHFGMGTSTSADEVVVSWPDGTVRTLADVPADTDLTVTCCAGWKNLQAGLAGPSGEPLLEGAGTLVEGDAISLTLTDGPPFAGAWFVLGLSRLDAAFEGGMLIPSLDITIPIPLDASGGFVIQDTWPADVPAGLQMFVQYWIEETGGWTASNAVSATVP